MIMSMRRRRRRRPVSIYRYTLLDPGVTYSGGTPGVASDIQGVAYIGR